jgi:hypothetical protein
MNLFNMRRAIASAALLVFMMGLGGVPSYGKNQSDVIETVGMGLPDAAITNETQRRATSRDAALVQAQAKMLTILQNTLSGSAADEEKLKLGILQGAYVVKTEWAADGSCRVTLKIKKPAAGSSI